MNPATTRLRTVTGASLFLALTCSACIEHSYTRTSAHKFPAKPDDCHIKMSSAGAPAGYEEIGTVGGCSRTSDLNEYKFQIREMVCQAGGDLVVAQVNGHGVYCLGTVFRKQADE